MTEEEKKAIEIVKEIWQFTDYSTDKIALKVVLDLIKKLQKENEELKNGKVYQDFKYYKELAGQYQGSCVPKDKIREIVKKLQSYSDIAEQQINQSTIIADSDSLNYGRKEAHITDIRLLKELLEEG